MFWAQSLPWNISEWTFTQNLPSGKLTWLWKITNLMGKSTINRYVSHCQRVIMSFVNGWFSIASLDCQVVCTMFVGQLLMVYWWLRMYVANHASYINKHIVAVILHMAYLFVYAVCMYTVWSCICILYCIYICNVYVGIYA